MSKLPTVTINGSLYFDDKDNGFYRLVSNPQKRIRYALVQARKMSSLDEETNQPATSAYPAESNSFNPQETDMEADTDKPDYKSIPKGKFRCFINLDKRDDKKYPAFVGGRISLPNQDGVERPFALWASKNPDTGMRTLTGRVGLTADQQIDDKIKPPPAHAADRDFVIPAKEKGGKDLVVEPNSLVFFEAKPKQAPDKEDEPAKVNTRGQPGREPDVYGYFNPGRGEPGQRLSGWKELDRNGNTKITGYVEEYQPRLEHKQAQERENDAPPKARKRARDHEHEHAQ